MNKFGITSGSPYHPIHDAMYGIVQLKSNKEIFEVCRVRTVEEAHDMLRKWTEYEPESNFEIIEIA